MFALEREMEEALNDLRDVEAGDIKLAANTTAGAIYNHPLSLNTVNFTPM